MRSTEVYRELRRVVAPRMKQLGFRRAKFGYLGYIRPFAAREIIVWFQCYGAPWSEWEGSSFCVNICVLRSSDRVDPDDWNQRLWFLLNRCERQEFVRLTNRVIAKFDPASAVALMQELFPRNRELHRAVARRLSPLKRVPVLMVEQWHRYYDSEDVRMWGTFVLGSLDRLMPELEDRAKGIDRLKCHISLGSGAGSRSNGGRAD